MSNFRRMLMSKVEEGYGADTLLGFDFSSVKESDFKKNKRWSANRELTDAESTYQVSYALNYLLKPNGAGRYKFTQSVNGKTYTPSFKIVRFKRDGSISWWKGGGESGFNAFTNYYSDGVMPRAITLTIDEDVEYVSFQCFKGISWLGFIHFGESVKSVTVEKIS